MTQDTQDRAPHTGEQADTKDALYYNTLTLSRFMRANYGDNAAQEAKRHVEMYLRIREPEIAQIWQRVVAHITRIEIVEDPRRVVKSITAKEEELASLRLLSRGTSR
jgi:hypothetical protein